LSANCQGELSGSSVVLQRRDCDDERAGSLGLRASLFQ
jgi:hypothetical protein